ncbi:uncharacterized protein LOC125674562 [Ostrea edulis]|uniref:uncharacterized protein LOC125674562 n=1 Tax=Ostrea edulis TaxID=37623 RepID=UPI0024AFF3B0|nr:uncharacterized protein LOC125674562 [Ostrea edulis]
MSYNLFGHVVDSCPLNQTEFTAAATRLNCTVDTNGRNQYTCVPKFDLTAIIEFCYNYTVALYTKGTCLGEIKNGRLDTINCSQFTEGCPSDNYQGNELYRFPPCFKINTEQRCFYADPSCPNETRTFTTEDGTIPTTTLMTVFNTTTNITSTLNTPVEQGTADVVTIIGSVVAVILFVICILSAVKYWIRWREKKKYSRVFREDPELVELNKDPERAEIELDRIKRRLGEYSTWRTPISDNFSSLSDDEVCVLFCFLCSDITDTDWLDIHNKIRVMVHGKASVTSEEAQRTLDELKSRGFLWDQDGVNIADDTKDETMYRVTERASLSFVYYLSSFTTAVRYLRSERYTRKSGEKCVISDDSLCDSLLIRRLQMDILTRVTMEDTRICDEVSRYLNILLDKVRMREGERGAFLEELQQTGECVQYRGGLQGSVQHVKWLWKYRFNARPDIVRSCIGLHPHWDIYIIDNTAYRKHSQYHDLPPAERCLLYCLLMVDDYTVKVKDESNIKVYNAIRERYFTQLPVCEEMTAANNHGEIIHVEKDMIKFKSDDIRHDVMYAFVTECLVEDSDLRFFLTKASCNVKSDYCRSWGYKRNEGERCLYIPDKPEEMYDLFIDGLQLEILTHSAMSDGEIHGRVTKRLNIPVMSDVERRKFLKDLQQTGECAKYRGGSQDSAQHVDWLWRNGRKTRPDIVRSCIGLHTYYDIYIINNTTYRKHSQYHDRPPAERCLLYCLLMVDEYTVKVKDESHIKMYNAIRERYFTEVPVCEEITPTNNFEGIVHIENDVIKFKTDDTRHDVMNAFVTECLVEDSDLKFFLTKASCHVISEYCRSWYYNRRKGERCLYIPEEPNAMYELFIDRLQLDILTHCTVSDRGIHDRISKHLRIPREVISWSDEARRRFVDNFRKGSIEMFRARGMIVGCAGAGKTTILRRLQRKQTTNMNTNTETTIGLEVHDDMFEIISDNLEGEFTLCTDNLCTLLDCPLDL